MSVDELAGVLDWAAAEGWNPGLDDAAAFHAADPDGFFLALDGARPVAAISVVNHGPAAAFLGLYIVEPACRGRGIGLALWTHALAHAGGRTVGLDGVPDQQENYAASGFVRAGETTRFAGEIGERTADGLRRATAAEIPVLLAMEGVASGWEKPAYMAAWLAGSETRETWLAERDGGIAGFATVRRCRDGAKIGPLVAADTATARALLARCAAEMGPRISVDVPAASGTLAALCVELGMTPGFETARMYRGRAPRQGAAIYAVGSLELG